MKKYALFLAAFFLFCPCFLLSMKEKIKNDSIFIRTPKPSPGTRRVCSPNRKNEKLIKEIERLKKLILRNQKYKPPYELDCGGRLIMPVYFQTTSLNQQYFPLMNYLHRGL